MKKHHSHFDFAQCDTLRMTILLAAVALQFAIFNPPSAISQALPGAGNCLQYNGTSDYVNVPHNVALNPSEITIEFWIWIDPALSADAQIVSKFTTITVGNINGYFVEIGDPGKKWIRFASGDYSMVNNDLRTPANSISYEEWMHVAATRDASNNAKIYINGILSASGIMNGTFGSANDLKISRNAMGAGDFCKGQIDEVRIWNRALTQTEIRNTMCQKLAGNEAGLVGYWRFDETSGTTAFDSSPNGNNGTLW